MLVLLNFSEEEVEIAVDGRGEGKVLFGNYEDVGQRSVKGDIKLRGWEGMILSTD